MDLVLAVDVANVVTRLAFAMKTENAQAVWSEFATHLGAWVRHFRPAAIVCCFEGQGEQLRRRWYSNYKANRKKNPIVADCMKVAYEQLIVGPHEVIQSGECEADDLIALVVQRSLEESCNVVIVSSDKDFRQLLKAGSVAIAQRISLSRGNVDRVAYVSEKSLLEETGLRPDQYADYLALVGDPSDNVPGCPSIGDKTAIRLLRAYPTLDDALTAPRFSLPLSNKQEQFLRDWAMHPDGLTLSRLLVNLYPPALSWRPRILQPSN